MSINVFFKQGTNPDLDAVNVQNRVARAVSQIPAGSCAGWYFHAETAEQYDQCVTLLYSTDSAYDEKFLQNYAKINVIPEIQRVPGVGSGACFWGQGLFHAHLAAAGSAYRQ